MKTPADVTQVADPRFPGIAITQMRLSPGKRHAHINHDRFAIAVTRAGHGCHRCGGCEYASTPGAAYLFGPDCVWTTMARDASQLAILFIDTQTLWQIAEQTGTSAAAVRAGSHSCLDPEATRLAGHLVDAALAHARFGVVLGALVDFIVALVPGMVAINWCNERPAVTYLRQRLNQSGPDKVPLSSLAKETSLSRFYLNRVFRQEVGVPPGEYAIRVRVAHAERLLRDGVAIAHAAHVAGFCDQSHLNRCFRRAFGVTPREYQSASRMSTVPAITMASALSYRFRDGVPLLRRLVQLRTAISSKTGADAHA
jgi:AraC-like DNA-binding protein